MKRLRFILGNKPLAIGIVFNILLIFYGLVGSALEGDAPRYARLSALTCALVYGVCLYAGINGMFRSTVVRLERYALLLKCYAPSGPLPQSYRNGQERWLSPDAYSVLLGATKKVEAKAASLLLIWSIIIAGSLSFITSKPVDDLKLDAIDWPLSLIVWTGLSTFPLLYCFRQLDTTDLPHDANTSGKSMEEAMIWQLVMKELGYRFSFYMMFATFILLPLSLAASAWEVEILEWIHET